MTSTVPFPTVPVGGFATTYVGRPGLLDKLAEHWRRAAGGATGAVLLAGEPGVGKTRTAAELGRRIHQEGATVLYGGCDEDLGTPYQPFIEALRWYTAGDDIGPLGRLPGELTRLMPDLARRVADLPEPVASDPAAEEHRLFEAVTSWLVDAARDNGLVLILDDLHWASKPTLLLVLHALHAATEAGTRMLVVVAYRDTDIDRSHPLSRVIGDLRVLPGVVRAPVDNLTESEVIEFMEANAGQPMGDAGRSLGAAVHAETDGNPFFVAEVLRHLVETGALRRGDDDRWIVAADLASISIPEGVRDVVGRRLSRLSANANEVLTVAAVQGRDVDVDVLVAVGDAAEPEVLDALDEAVAARLVEDTGFGGFRFAHALVRTTLYDELLATRRRRLHRHTADALEKLRSTDVVALAYHAAEGGDTERALRYGLAAADQSLADRALADAEDRFRHVLDMLQDVDPGVGGHERVRVAALCGLGESQRDQGNRDFRETLLEAAGLARGLGETALLVRAVLANSRGFASIMGAVDEERIELIEAALEAIGPEPSADRARLVAQLAAEVMFGGDNERRLALSDEAEAMAREVGGGALLAWVIARTGYAATIPSRGEQLIARGAEGTRLADATGDPALRVHCRILYAGALLSAGRIDESFAVTDEMVAIGDAEGSPADRWIAHMCTLPSVLAREGAVAFANSNDHCLGIGQDAGVVDALQWWGATASSAFWLMGEGGDMADAAGTFAYQFPGLPVWFSGYTWMLCEDGRHDQARAVIEEQGLRFNTLEDGSLPLCGTQQLASVAWELGDVEMAANLLPVLEKYADRWSHYFMVPVGPIVWGIGALASVLGDHDRAVTLVEEALAKLLDAGFVDHAVHCRMHLARILRTRGAAGDDARARQHLADARAHAESVPAPRMVAKIDELGV